MAPKSPTLTIKTLHTLLTRIGSATSGRKEHLISRLSRDLKIPRLPVPVESKKSIRILSIDMGIKNLAFCVMDVSLENSTSQNREKSKDCIGIEAKVASWRRLDVVEEASRPKEKRIDKTESLGKDGEIEDPYMPSALSRTAYTLLVHTLLPFNPDIVLIERQRWRSAGGVAIQQWTVRVNMLEGMLWAILSALRAETKTTDAQKHNYEIFGVDPKRVGTFWIGERTRTDMGKRGEEEPEEELIMGLEGELEDSIETKKKPTVKKLSRGKVEKKAKIQLLRSWLTPNSRSTVVSSTKGSKVYKGDSNPGIAFTFSPDAENTRAALCATEKVKGGHRSVKSGTSELAKLDDVTDCFLQAAAWVAWEVNRTKMLPAWDEKNGIIRDLNILGGGMQDEAKSRGKGKVAMRGNTRKK